MCLLGKSWLPGSICSLQLPLRALPCSTFRKLLETFFPPPHPRFPLRLLFPRENLPQDLLFQDPPREPPLRSKDVNPAAIFGTSLSSGDRQGGLYLCSGDPMQNQRLSLNPWGKLPQGSLCPEGKEQPGVSADFKKRSWEAGHIWLPRGRREGGRQAAAL